MTKKNEMKKQDVRTTRQHAPRSEAVVDQSCRVEMLGGLMLIRADLPTPVTRFTLQKASALLAWLALTRRPQPRERIIDLFWPDMDPTAARDNLSTTLGSLRRQLEPPGVARGAVLAANHTQVGLNPAAVTTDVADFERLLDRAADEGKISTRIDLLLQAIELYKGDLLPGFYYDWSLGETVRLQARCAEALKRLRDDHEALGNPASALDAARQLVATDTYSEEAYIHLIRLQVLTGRVKDATDSYRKVCALFEEEFGAPLSVSTSRSIEDLLAQPAAEPATQSVTDVRSATSLSVVDVPVRSNRPESTPETTGRTRGEAPTLPVILSQFFGREAELDQLAGLLLSHKGIPDGPDLPPRPNRLVTLIGLGGNGKTRLSLEFLRQTSGRLGIWCAFVSLADLTVPAQIPERIAAALKLRLAPATETSPLDQVATLLARFDSSTAPSAILALDNLEHLLPLENGPEIPNAGETARIVQTLLERVPGLAILCTSRQRLGLRGERLVPVGPLPVPEEGVRRWALGVREQVAGVGPQAIPDPRPPESDAQRQTPNTEFLTPNAQRLTPNAEFPTPNALLHFPSVRLYLDRAQAARPDFSLTATNAEAVAALCRHLEGSPLAIELAAAWVRMLPPRKMWERLTQGLEIPEGGYSDLPARHRSLNAALEWSYRLLSPEAQRFLARLCVFTGGWTIEAATDVAGDGDEFHTLQLLSRLQEASLVTMVDAAGELSDEGDGPGRYRFLETVRAYASQRLKEQGETEARRRRHAVYFLEFAAVADLDLRGPRQAEWLSRLEADHDNLRMALSFFLDMGVREDAEAAQRLSSALIRFWQVRGHWHEGRRHMQEVLARTERITGPSAIRARIMNGAGAFALEQGDYAQARELYEAALAMRRIIGDRARVGDSLHNLGHLALIQADYDRARICYEESLAIAREVGDILGVADELHHLGWLAQDLGNLDQALSLYEESLATRRPLGDRRGIAFTLHNLSNAYFALKDTARALQLHEESLAIRRELGDRKGVAASYANRSRFVLETGDYATARQLLVEALKIFQEIGEVRELMIALYALADVEAARGHLPRAVQLYGAAEALQQTSGQGLSAVSGEPAPWAAKAREILEGDVFEQHRAAGQRMTQAEAVAFTMQED